MAYEKLADPYCSSPEPSSNVHRPSPVMRRQQFALNNIFSETTRPRLLIFGKKHCLEDLYQICSNGGPGDQNGPGAEDLGNENKIYVIIFLSRTARLRCLKFGM